MTQVESNPKTSRPFKHWVDYGGKVLQYIWTSFSEFTLAVSFIEAMTV